MEGPSEIRKLKEAKQQHIWSLQIMNMLIQIAKKFTYESNPQNYESSCFSEYKYFTRGGSNLFFRGNFFSRLSSVWFLKDIKVRKKRL